MGWDVTTGFCISTVGPVPESGTVPMTIAPSLGGQTVVMPMGPLSSESLAAWHGYSLEMHGWLAPDPEHPRDPVWSLFEDDGTPLHPLELDRIRVRAAGSDLYAELIALPIEGRPIRTGIFGWNESRPRRIPPPDDVEKAIHGLELLGLVRDELEAARKRAPGPIPDFKDADELRAAVITAVRAEWLRTKEKPTLPRIARYFSRHPKLPSANGASLGKRLKRAGLDWDRLLREGEPSN